MSTVSFCINHLKRCFLPLPRSYRWCQTNHRWSEVEKTSFQGKLPFSLLAVTFIKLLLCSIGFFHQTCGFWVYPNIICEISIFHYICSSQLQSYISGLELFTCFMRFTQMYTFVWLICIMLFQWVESFLLV